MWSSIAEQETATQGINPSLILKLLLYADLTVCYQLIFPIDTHIHSCTHTQREKNSCSVVGSKNVLKKSLNKCTTSLMCSRSTSLPNKIPYIFNVHNNEFWQHKEKTRLLWNKWGKKLYRIMQCSDSLLKNHVPIEYKQDFFHLNTIMASMYNLHSDNWSIHLRCLQKNQSYPE